VTDATYRGYEGGLKWRDDLFDVVDDARYEIDEILAAGPDYVVVANHVAGRGSSSGVPVELRWASVFWLRKGQIARVAGFERRRDALRAVGLAD
jgi:ketosteroid isomerase-like protein